MGGPKKRQRTISSSAAAAAAAASDRSAAAAGPDGASGDSRMQTRISAEVGEILPQRIRMVGVGLTYARAAAEMAREYGEGELDVAARNYVPVVARDELETPGIPDWLHKHMAAIAKEYESSGVTSNAVVSEDGLLSTEEVEREADEDRVCRRHANGDEIPINGLSAHVSSRYNALPDDPDERARADFQRALWNRLQSAIRQPMRNCGAHLMNVYAAMGRRMDAMGGVATGSRTILDQDGLVGLAVRACQIAMTDDAYMEGITNACEYPWKVRIEKMGGQPVGVRVPGVIRMDDPITVSHMNLMLQSTEMHPRWPGCARRRQCIFNVPTGAGTSVEVSYSAPKPEVVGYLTAKEATGAAPMPASPRPCIRCMLQYMAVAYSETVRAGYLTPAFASPLCFAKGSDSDQFPPDVFFPETEPGNSVHIGMSQIVNVDKLGFGMTTTAIDGVSHQHYYVQFGGNFPKARSCMTTH